MPSLFFYHTIVFVSSPGQADSLYCLALSLDLNASHFILLTGGVREKIVDTRERLGRNH